MAYINISIHKNDNDRKYLLFYADYLQEAWLSEVLEDDTTRIVKQFRCKNIMDVETVAAYLTKSGQVVNLAANDDSNQRLKTLEHRLNEARNTRRTFTLPTWSQFYAALLAPFSAPALQ